MKGANFAADENRARVLFAYAFASTSRVYIAQLYICMRIYTLESDSAKVSPSSDRSSPFELSIDERPRAREFRHDVNHVFIVHGFAWRGT